MRYVLLILLTLLFSADSRAALTDKHTRELKQLDVYYRAVDSYLNGISPALHADVKTAVSAKLKAILLDQAAELSRPLVNSLLEDLYKNIKAEEVEAALVVTLLAQIAEINAGSPGAITVPNNPTSAQLRALIAAWEAANP